jgi:hypothetical protein
MISVRYGTCPDGPSSSQLSILLRIGSEDWRLARLTKICLALPEAARRDSGSHAAFLEGVPRRQRRSRGGAINPLLLACLPWAERLDRAAPGQRQGGHLHGLRRASDTRITTQSGQGGLSVIDRSRHGWPDRSRPGPPTSTTGLLRLVQGVEKKMTSWKTLPLAKQSHAEGGRG